ncbi:hypothetical protein ACSFC1_03655 [Pseudothermotoga sp. U03pept]|uniref:hypothetical protein n=1 Tax=Pseudothermotoga sp. U03pept TaxID=3447012 RepID=UPI003F018A56
MRKLLLVFSLSLALGVFALNMENSLRIYRQLVDQYNRGETDDPFLSLVERELHNLSLYRYYRILIAGSSDKREAMPDVGDYLGTIYDVAQPNSEDEQLAYSLFLSYLVAKMNRTNLSTDSIMKNSAFVKFFSSYRDTLSKEARTFFAWIMSYQLGLCQEKPPVDVERIAQLEIDYTFVPPSNLQHLNDLGIFYSDPYVKQILSEALQRTLENLNKDPTRAAAHINRESAFVARDISKPITTFQAQVAQKAVTLTSKLSKAWWLRFLVYLFLIFLTIRNHKVLKIVLSLVIAFEIFYLLYLFDFLSQAESLLYGLVAVSSFLFALLLVLRENLKKRGFVQLTIGCVAIVVFFIPFVFSCDALSMNNFEQLKESIYYSALKKELFQDELSKLSYLTRSMSSTLYVSMDETKKVLTEFADTLSRAQKMKAFEELTISSVYIDFSPSFDFYNSDGFEKRLTLFSGPSKDLQSYLLDEKSRNSDFQSSYKKFQRYVDRVMTYSADYLRKDFELYLKELFNAKYPILSNLFSKIPFDHYNGLEAGKPDIPLSRERTTLSIMLCFMIVYLCSIIFKEKIFALPSIVLGVCTVMKWFSIKNFEVFVEQGIPTLRFDASGWVNPGIFIVVIVLVIFNLYKLFRKGEKAV